MAGESELYAVIQKIRHCFQLLATESNAMLQPLGMTASQRAIVEHLAEYGPDSVARIAQHKSVARQSVQVLADQLVAKQLVVLSPNPAHRRSPLLLLSEDGERAFAQIRQQEFSALSQIAAELPLDAIGDCYIVLEALSNQLTKRRDLKVTP